MRLRPLSFDAASPLPNEGQLLMTIFELDQAEEEILAHQISDEALERRGVKLRRTTRYISAQL
jgi:hypothetical protein